MRNFQKLSGSLPYVPRLLSGKHFKPQGGFSVRNALIKRETSSLRLRSGQDAMNRPDTRHECVDEQAHHSEFQ